MTTVTRPHSSTANSGGDWDTIREQFLTTGDAAAAIAGRNKIVESRVISAYHDHLVPGFPDGVAVLAVGGFGRRDLFPHSDVDVLLLVEKQPSGKARDGLSTFLRELWDSGLRLSHSVRTPKECCEVHGDNVELNISLLDQRFLAGDHPLYEKLTERLPRFLHSQRAQLIRHLCELTRPRHRKFQNTIYHLEPDVKETPGGLRDLHLLQWLDKLRDDSQVASEWLAGLEPCQTFLSALRCFLHFRAGRDDNSLSFDAQEEIAEQPFFPFDKPEDWMRQYFLHARSVHRAAIRAMDLSEGRNSSLLKEFRSWRTRLSNAEFSVSRERVFFKAPQTIRHDPELVMRLFQFVGRHGLQLALETERRIAEYLSVIEKHYAQPGPHWPALLETLTLPKASRAINAMHETGVLGAVIPEWKGIECLVTRDFYHRYTVDEHTLLALQSLDELATTEDSARKRFADLLSEVQNQDVLRLAVLLHDIGKGEGTGSHTERSLMLAEPAMERIQLPIRKRNMVRFLIERHLELSTVMSGRDLEDPATARFLADTVQTVEKLKNLVLLTYADINAVNPAAMTPWRIQQLWMVYLAAYNELTRELESDRIHHLENASAQTGAFVEGFPNRYLRTHSQEEIDRHVELERQSHKKGVALHIEKLNGAYQLTILAKDRPFLLTSIAGALASFGMNILKAEAFANEQGTILDTFTFEDPNRTLELNPQEMDRLTLTLERVTLGRVRARDLLKNRRAPAPLSKGSRIRPRISFNTEASETATLIEVVAEDRPGLLYELTRRLSEAGCNIEVVLIDTEAHKAIDVFYVTREGRKLTDDEAAELETTLLETSQPG